MSKSILNFISAVVLTLAVSEVVYSQSVPTTVVAQGILKMRDGKTSAMVVEMTGLYMAECWANPSQQGCGSILWSGSLNGRKVGNTSNGGSTYTQHIFSGGKTPYMQMRDCGPYVGACEYSWVGSFNPSTQAYEGEISFYPATYGRLTIYKNNARFYRKK